MWIDCEGQEKSKGWNAPAHGQHTKHDSATETREARTTISAALAHAVRLSIAVCVACSNLTVAACWLPLWRVVGGGIRLYAQQVRSRKGCGSQPDRNFWSNSCSCVHSREGIRLRACVWSTEQRISEGSELGGGASMRSEMRCSSQQRIVPARHDVCGQMRIREGHAAAHAAEMHCCWYTETIASSKANSRR